MNRQEFDTIFHSLRIVQTPEGFWWLVDRVQKLNPQIIIELGVGGSTKFWEQLLPPKGLLICIDKSESPHFDYKQSDREVHLIQGWTTSEDTVNQVKAILGNRQADFIYNDASYPNIVQFPDIEQREHHPVVCEAEFNLYIPFLKPNGLMGFDDSNDVRQFLNKLIGVETVDDTSIYENLNR